MSETTKPNQDESNGQTETDSLSDEEKRNRVYQISANRGRASHKMRYVESSSADNGNCRLCVGALSPEDGSDHKAEQDNDQDQ